MKHSEFREISEIVRVGMHGPNLTPPFPEDRTLLKRFQVIISSDKHTGYHGGNPAPACRPYKCVQRGDVCGHRRCSLLEQYQVNFKGR